MYFKIWIQKGKWKKLGDDLKKVFKKDINNDLIQNSKKIYYRIKKVNNDNIANFPSKLLIQILDILNREQIRKEKINNEILLSNIRNILNSNDYNYEQKSFYKYLESFAKNNNNNKIGELFFIFFQKKISNFQNINYIFEHKFVFELNLYDIYKVKLNNGTLKINNNIPQLNLIECIMEIHLPKIHLIILFNVLNKNFYILHHHI